MPHPHTVPHPCSPQGYRGHVFWDEVYMFPFYLSKFPEIAKSHLQVRSWGWSVVGQRLSLAWSVPRLVRPSPGPSLPWSVPRLVRPSPGPSLAWSVARSLRVFG